MKKQWKRYSNILTNDTKFDSKALKNMYQKIVTKDKPK